MNSRHQKWNADADHVHLSALNFTRLLDRVLGGQEMTLPEFNPRSEECDSRAWIKTVVFFTQNWTVRTAPYNALIQSFKTRRCQLVNNRGTSWSDLGRIPNCIYYAHRTLAGVFLKRFGEQPKEGESLLTFAARTINTITAQCREADIEEMAVSMALAQFATVSQKARHLAFTTNIKTRDRLMQELRAISMDIQKKFW